MSVYGLGLDGMSLNWSGWNGDQGMDGRLNLVHFCIWTRDEWEKIVWLGFVLSNRSHVALKREGGCLGVKVKINMGYCSYAWVSLVSLGWELDVIGVNVCKILNLYVKK
jgi:hypothetical protein